MKKAEPLSVFSDPAALTDEIDRLRAENERLREYAQHRPNCDSSAPECCCGLDSLLEESK